MIALVSGSALSWSGVAFLAGFALGVFVTMITGLSRLSGQLRKQTLEAKVAAEHAEKAAERAEDEASKVRELSSQHYTKQEADHRQVIDKLNEVLGGQG